jgi:hypothetical protein
MFEADELGLVWQDLAGFGMVWQEMARFSLVPASHSGFAVSLGPGWLANGGIVVVSFGDGVPTACFFQGT